MRVASPNGWPSSVRSSPTPTVSTVPRAGHPQTVRSRRTRWTLLGVTPWGATALRGSGLQVSPFGPPALDRQPSQRPRRGPNELSIPRPAAEAPQPPLDRAEGEIAVAVEQREHVEGAKRGAADRHDLAAAVPVVHRRVRPGFAERVALQRPDRQPQPAREPLCRARASRLWSPGRLRAADGRPRGVRYGGLGRLRLAHWARLRSISRRSAWLGACLAAEAVRPGGGASNGAADATRTATRVMPRGGCACEWRLRCGCCWR